MSNKLGRYDLTSNWIELTKELVMSENCIPNKTDSIDFVNPFLKNPYV